MRSSPTFATLIAATSLLAWPAAAEITPEEVWADWQRMIATYGMSLDVGSEQSTASAVTLTDVAMAFAFDEEGGTFNTLIPEMVFEARGDGTVEITISPEFDIDITGTDTETGVPFAFTATTRQPGVATIASRNGDTTRYDYIGADASAVVNGIEVDGEMLDFTIEATLRGMTGSYEVTEGTPRRFSSKNAGDALVVTVDGTDPEDPATTFDLNLTMNDYDSEGSGTISALAGFADMSTMLTEGFATEWNLSHGAAEYTINGTGPTDRFSMTTTATGGDFAGVISPEGLAYGGGNTGVTVALSGSDIPFPQLTFSVAETEGRVAIPAVPSDEATDFGLLLRMIDLEVSEGIWGMFDPAGQLPRDPATLVVDLVGKGRWLVDVFDPAFAESAGPDDIPAEVEALTINQLQLTIAGAELTGDGAFEFDNTPGGPFAPAPTPSGAINLELTGGNTLLDTLVNMGLLPQEQAMGTRMMLGLFARPGDGPDTLVSTIEVGEDGSVSANGQRIR